MRKSGRGFTMIELAIVISILVFIVLVIVFPSVMGAREQKNLVSCGGNLKAIGEAITLYAREHYARVPAEDSLENDLKPAYISNIPLCPSSNNTYDYQTDANFMEYTILCQGLNHKRAKAPTDYPRYTPGSGLDLGNKLNIH
ncbi:MAG: type II secretion system protein [bacterium]